MHQRRPPSGTRTVMSRNHHRIHTTVMMMLRLPMGDPTNPETKKKNRTSTLGTTTANWNHLFLTSRPSQPDSARRSDRHVVSRFETPSRPFRRDGNQHHGERREGDADGADDPGPVGEIRADDHLALHEGMEGPAGHRTPVAVLPGEAGDKADRLDFTEFLVGGRVPHHESELPGPDLRLDPVTFEIEPVHDVQRDEAEFDRCRRC